EEASRAAGERVWRLPLADEYLELLSSEVADYNNSAGGGAGSITAALYLREFVGSARDRWAHIDMSPPSWADSGDAELVKGATGWGVRTLLRWLTSLSAAAPESIETPTRGARRHLKLPRVSARPLPADRRP